MTWDYAKIEYQKQAVDKKWYFERLISYGLNGQKLDKKMLEKYLPEINIPDDRRAFLELLIWNKKF